MANDTSKSIRTSLVDVQRAVISWSHVLAIQRRKKAGSVHPSGGSEGQAEHAAAKFFAPEHKRFPYNLVYTPLSGKRKTREQKIVWLGSHPAGIRRGASLIQELRIRHYHTALGIPSDCCSILLQYSGTVS